MQQVLSAQKIAVSYGRSSGENELTNVTLSFVPGQITAIVGPNGSGKSTLVRAISRVCKPKEGAVFVNADDLYAEVSAETSAQIIGVAPQDTHISFDFTTREVVSMGLSPYRSGWSRFAGESKEERLAVDTALEQAELSNDLAHRPIMTLSGGERQRALIARTLVQRASVIILDEPTASLDLRYQAAFFRHLQEIKSKGNVAIVVVLHDLNVAASNADRIVMLCDGQIVADGSPQDVLTADNIRVVYRVDAIISIDFVTGRPSVSVLPHPKVRHSLAGKRFHLLCGGGGGAEIIRKLIAAEATVTAGWLNEGDIDRVTADIYQISYGELSAFRPVPRFTADLAAQIAAQTDAVIVCPKAIDDGNSELIDTSFGFADLGSTIFVLRDVVRSIENSMNAPIVSLRSKFLLLLSSPSVTIIDSFDELAERFAGEEHA